MTLNYSCRNIECNVIINTGVLIDLLRNFVGAQYCDEKMNIVHDVEKKKGLARVLCTKCPFL